VQQRLLEFAGFVSTRMLHYNESHRAYTYERLPSNMNRIFFVTVCAVCIVSCGKTDLPEPADFSNTAPLSSGNRDSFELKTLPFDERPNLERDSAWAYQVMEPIDSDSIEMFVWEGDNYYHPVFMCQRSHGFLTHYVRTGDEQLLMRAEKYMQKLMSLCHEELGAMFAPYTFTFGVHNDRSLTLEQPWYSGMAQGEMLTVLSRLYEFTGKEEYLTFADKLLGSFMIAPSESDNWVVRLDSADYYWIEEYPHPKHPGMTLNGFITSMCGVWEYYTISGNETARHICEMSLTTLKRYIPEHLEAEERSYYCLGHKRIANDHYHRLHATQMHDLHRMTGDSFFLEMAGQFESRTASE
jgi:hypothetical protein